MVLMVSWSHCTVVLHPSLSHCAVFLSIFFCVLKMNICLSYIVTDCEGWNCGATTASFWWVYRPHRVRNRYSPAIQCMHTWGFHDHMEVLGHRWEFCNDSTVQKAYTISLFICAQTFTGSSAFHNGTLDSTDLTTYLHNMVPITGLLYDSTLKEN